MLWPPQVTNGPSYSAYDLQRPLALWPAAARSALGELSSHRPPEYKHIKNKMHLSLRDSFIFLQCFFEACSILIDFWGWIKPIENTENKCYVHILTFGALVDWLMQSSLMSLFCGSPCIFFLIRDKLFVQKCHRGQLKMTQDWTVSQAMHFSLCELMHLHFSHCFVTQTWLLKKLAAIACT